MEDRPLLSIVIVSWNTRSLLECCLTSIRQFLKYRHEVIVVDNASTDGSVDMVRQKFPDVMLLSQALNLGFSRANNIGWRRATGQYVVFLNSDTELIEDPFQPLIAWVREHPDTGAIAPEILNPDRSHQPSVRVFPGWLDQAITLLKLRHVLRSSPPMRRYLSDPGSGQRWPVEVDQLMGACILLPHDVILKLGGWDEGYWIWFEDVDLCRRTKQLGLKVIYAPMSRLVHFGGSSFGQVLSLKKHRWWLQSLWRYTRTFWPPLAWGSLAVLMPISYILTIIQTIIKPR